MKCDESLDLDTTKHGVLLHAGSDGGGGVHGGDPRLRRVGWSWVVTKPCGAQVGGISGSLQHGDDHQTIPRAELFAVVHFAANVKQAEHQRIVLWVDNSGTVDGCISMAYGWVAKGDTANGDLWGALNSHGGDRLRSGQLEVRKVKSHLPKEESMSRGFPYIA